MPRGTTRSGPPTGRAARRNGSRRRGPGRATGRAVWRRHRAAERLRAGAGGPGGTLPGAGAPGPGTGAGASGGGQAAQHASHAFGGGGLGGVGSFGPWPFRLDILVVFAGLAFAGWAVFRRRWLTWAYLTAPGAVMAGVCWLFLTGGWAG